MHEAFKILVAEDNAINQKVIRVILNRMGYEYDIAEDGLMALSMYQSDDYSLILMDCQMPNLDGLKATEKIRDFEKSHKKTRCPIIAMTANAMTGDKERCLSYGMDDFLAKPFKAQDLVTIINRWIPSDLLKVI